MNDIVSTAAPSGRLFFYDPKGNAIRCCGNCIAFRMNPRTNNQGGECRLMPPSVIVVQSTVVTREGSQSHIQTIFPPVPVQEQCISGFMLDPELNDIISIPVAKGTDT